MTQFEDVLETILEEYARRDSEGEFDTWEETDAFVKKKAEVLLAYVKEEPVSEELEKIVEEIAEPTILNAYGTKELARRLRNTICCTSVSEDLEEAMQYNAPDIIGIDDLLYWRNGFIAGAKWQKQQGQSTIELAEDHAMLAGMEKMKEQMMANGVDGVVHHFEKCKVASVHYNDPTGIPMAYFTSPEGLSAGDKVKIIVIKED